MRTLNRRPPSRRAIARALRDIEMLWHKSLGVHLAITKPFHHGAGDNHDGHAHAHVGNHDGLDHGAGRRSKVVGSA